MDEITHTAFMHNYSVGISGGKENDYKFNLGLNYINQDGTIKKSNYERFSVRQSTEKTVLKDHLVVGTNASIARSTDASISEMCIRDRGMPIAEYVIYTVRIPDIAYDRYKIQFLILLLQFQA